jgi:hypothetical protein
MQHSVYELYHFGCNILTDNAASLIAENAAVLFNDYICIKHWFRSGILTKIGLRLMKLVELGLGLSVTLDHDNMCVVRKQASSF